MLLAGTQPERILCLTYTKAAAAEMSTRVFSELGFWVTKSGADLDAALRNLLSRLPTAAETERARSLFARAIETPGGLKVQTIHAFAERLLQRFPLEAGVPPGFSILDDVMARQLLRDAIDSTLHAATRAPASPLGMALTTTVAFAADENFDAILSAALEHKDWLEYVVKVYGHDENGMLRDPYDAIARDYRATFAIGRDQTRETIDHERLSLLPDEFLRRARDVLAQSSTVDQEIANNITDALNAQEESARLEALSRVYLTKSMTPRADSRFCLKAVCEKEPALTQQLRDARDRFADLTDKRRALDVIEATISLMRLADAVLTRFSSLKARRAALDFEDLIRHTVGLLRTSEAAQWVLYKLDGGLDHILVDESQDTSPQQWRIVESLAAEFFAGSGTREDWPPITTASASNDIETSSGQPSPPARTLFAVGDEKQSIYSFQGARPEEFARMGNVFRKHAKAAGVPWHDIPLTLSFRTVAPILNAVDRVFADAQRTPGLTAYTSNKMGATTTNPIAHAAHRIGHAGLVEIWDTEKAGKDETHDAWTPDEGTGEIAPAVRLAERIADRIKEMTESGERLLSEDRPITPGDILILVRKRHPFANPMVAALKSRGIAVAGADRLSLADQIAVQDLIALGDFLTLPEDDLALANVLKSPLFGFDDDDLLAIAHGRKGTLWKALLDQRDRQPAYESAASLLRDWRRRADFLPPYEFLTGVLDRDGMRQKLLGRLGPEAADGIDELINLAIAFDDEAPPSLTGFLVYLRESTRQIKRDMDHGRDEVRIMTVHGAKGLEAPVVFLPDTCTTSAAGRRSSLVPLELPRASEQTPPAFIWKIKDSKDLAPIATGDQKVKDREQEELNRLLYVAMTRARDRLYVSGFEGKKKRPADCWYDLILSGLENALVEATNSQGNTVRRIETSQSAVAGRRKSSLSELHSAMPLEPWALAHAPREETLTMPLAPSRLAPYDVDEAGDPLPATPGKGMPAHEDPPAAPPRVLSSGNRFLRGTLTHALLEHLPKVPADKWQAAAKGFVAARGQQLSAKVRQSIITETLSILENSEFACLFGPDSRAEVPIAAQIPRPSGRGPALKLNGQIDRLAIDGKRVFIIDYKTNRPPPSDVEKVADAYLYQLAAYRLALAQLFPDKALKIAILWTDGPRLMEFSAARLDSYERRLWQLNTSNLDAT